MYRVFIYKKQHTFQKARQFPLHFCIKKAIHFTLRDFSWNFWSWHLKTKSMTLWVTWRFYINKNLDISQKRRQFAIRFYIQKSSTLRYAIFYWIFEICRGEGHLFIKKTMHLRYVDIQRAWHYALHFNIQKTMHFSLRLYIYNLSCSTDT